MKTTITNQGALEPAYARRATARATADAAGSSLKRGERLLTVANETAADLEQRLEKVETEQAQRLAAAIAAGRPTSASPADIADDELAAELAAARFHASVSARAVATLKGTGDEAQAELAAAEAAVIAAVDSILDSEDIELARQISDHLSKAVRLGKSLLLSTIATEMTTRRQPNQEVKAVLEKLDHLIDRHHIAINILRTGDQDALGRRSARRDAMIARECAPVEIAAA